MANNQAIKQAIRREKDLGEFVLNRYSKKLSKFEKKYRVKTEKFVLEFEKGNLGDKQDYFEWFALFKAKKHWEEKLKQLKAA